MQSKLGLAHCPWEIYQGGTCDIALDASEWDNENILPIFTGATATGFPHGPSARVSLVE